MTFEDIWQTHKPQSAVPPEYVFPLAAGVQGAVSAAYWRGERRREGDQGVGNCCCICRVDGTGGVGEE